MAGERFRHLFLVDHPGIEPFTSPSSGGTKKRIPSRNRQTHSEYLMQRFIEAWQEAEAEQAVHHVDRNGVYIEFKSDLGADLVIKSLEDLRSKKVRLLNVRTEGEGDERVTYATVYVAHEKKRHFLKKIEEYALQVTPGGKPKNADLVNSIADLRKALLVESFWQDNRDLMPAGEKAWCEVWLSSDRDEVRQRFEALLEREGIKATSGFIRFPERTVKVILANRQDLERLTAISDDIAEYRRAKDTAAFWLRMENREQAEWVRDLLGRIQVESDSRVAVCILDTGVNNGHPLLQPVLKDEDCLTVNPVWGIDDHDGHGTLMAGIVAYGDLTDCLAKQEAIRLRHSLESVKILPRPPAQNAQELWGFITAQGVSRAEIQAVGRKRIFCLAVSATDTRDRGRPSSWSARLDQLSSGADDDLKRLFIVCAGNVSDLNAALNYPDAQLTDSIHDPGQAWNVLTVGAYTELDEIRDPALNGFVPLVRSGELSPFTTTSFTWDNRWPIKPEIVMEGGNLAHDGQGFYDESDDLSLLSTYRDPATRYFYGFNMTSASTAQAAWLAAQIQNEYPDIWPETVRALIVHSAEWTEALKARFLPDQSKTSWARLLRICGYGVPSLERALYSASNSLTLIAQEEIQPFDRKKNGSGYKTREMHLYELPWPKEVLIALPDNVQVQMRITLSYFIEPGPGEIGWKDRYRYASHALRFDVKSPNERTKDFLRRINAAVRAEEEGHPGTKSASDHWVIGANGRNKGSIHSDIWLGTAAELAASNVIAVYPVTGWWRERAYLGRWNRRSRYSLIVSISTTEENIDIYTPVANKLGISVPVAVNA
ncbi:S8 family serine peptidase [Desulfofundulus thermobenzoicus]|uniref:S8 family serine peptidase n=1 Tax=Desulfofundulus thermobenzoicus TaxID=29376 RepID=A0A6N7IRV0_9FIRM|nr:S8 family serine peptidase [Desulfofundulus thermobenzoicus]